MNNEINQGLSLGHNGKFTMLAHPYSDESDSDTNWHTTFVLLNEDAMIQRLVAQGYVLSERQKAHVRVLLQCKTARLQDIVIAMSITKQLDDSDYRLGWSRSFLA